MALQHSTTLALYHPNDLENQENMRHIDGVLQLMDPRLTSSGFHLQRESMNDETAGDSVDSRLDLNRYSTSRQTDRHI